MKFGDAYSEILRDEKSKLYLFFPVKSRFSFNHSELGALEVMQDEINDVVHQDLDLDRIWKGFGKKSTHKTFYGSQLIIGRGTNSTKTTTGTGWHCAAGNNWFIQVHNTLVLQFDFALIQVIMYTTMMLIITSNHEMCTQVFGTKRWYFMDPKYSKVRVTALKLPLAFLSFLVANYTIAPLSRHQYSPVLDAPPPVVSSSCNLCVAARLT